MIMMKISLVYLTTTVEGTAPSCYVRASKDGTGSRFLTSDPTRPGEPTRPGR